MANHTTEFLISRPVATGKTVTADDLNFAEYKHDGESLKWSAKFPLPQIGDEITIKMNGIGRAVVRGYFKENGYVGVMTWALNPPAWLVKQRANDLKSPRAAKMPQWWRDGIGCEFGAEIDIK